MRCFHCDIYRFAAEVIAVDNAVHVRHTEHHLAVDILLRLIVETHHARLQLRCANKHRRKRLFLTVELIKHQLQRSPIGRHLVSVAAHKVVAALAQLENLGGGCFGTLHQRLARHHVLRKHA